MPSSISPPMRPVPMIATRYVFATSRSSPGRMVPLRRDGYGYDH
jgi:hypothetical protein